MQLIPGIPAVADVKATVGPSAIITQEDERPITQTVQEQSPKYHLWFVCTPPHATVFVVKEPDNPE